MKPKPTNESAHTLVHLIAELAEAQGLTLGALAKKSAVSERTICRWRSGDTVPNIIDLGRVFKALGHTLAIIPEETQ
jgi:transcriptional regulator with XRE-family HTH domain